MSQWSEAFAELVRLVQPDSDPVLTRGNGTTAEATKELDGILLTAARGATWTTITVYAYDQVVFPTVRNGHQYRVSEAGTAAVTEPDWPLEGYVTDGTVTLFEDGPDYSNIYNVREAARKAWFLKASKASEYLEEEEPVYKRCVEQANRYASIGVA